MFVNYLDYDEEDLHVLFRELYKRYTLASRLNFAEETKTMLEKNLQAVKEAIEIKKRERFLTENTLKGINPFSPKNNTLIITPPSYNKKKDDSEAEKINKRGVALETDPYLAKLDELEEERDDLIDLDDLDDFDDFSDSNEK